MSKQTDENILITLLRVSITTFKVVVRFVTLGIVFTDNVRRDAIQSKGFIYRANKSSVDDLMSYNVTKKEYKYAKEIIEGL